MVSSGQLMVINHEDFQKKFTCELSWVTFILVVYWSVSLYPILLTIELDLYFTLIYLHTKYEVDQSSLLKVIDRKHICYSSLSHIY